MAKIRDLLGGPRPNIREHNIGATKTAKSTKAVGKSSQKSGFTMAPQSFQNPPGPSSRNSGNTFKAKPGAKQEVGVVACPRCKKDSENQIGFDAKCKKCGFVMKEMSVIVNSEGEVE